MSFWLTYPNSLTQKLKEIAKDVHLNVLREQWEAPDLWDKKHLLDNSIKVFHREILMYAGNLACWYARTTIPQATYQANPQLFSRLQHESLGDIIYHESIIERTHLNPYLIDDQMDEYHRVKVFIPLYENQLWARYSSFIINKRDPFYLVEIFLPDLERFTF